MRVGASPPPLPRASSWLHSSTLVLSRRSAGVLASSFASLLFLFCFVFVNLTQARTVWEEGTSAEKIPLSDGPEGNSGARGNFLD